MFDDNDKNNWIKCGSIMSCGAGKVLLGWGTRRWMTSPSSAIQNEVFYFPDFFLQESHPWFEHTVQQEMEVTVLRQMLDSHRSDPESDYTWECHDRELFEASFSDLHQKFASKDIDKAVPFVFEVSAAAMSSQQLTRSIASLLENLCRYPMHIYGFWDQNQGVLGITPEILFNFGQSGKLQTMACAGTSSLKAEIKDLFNDPKELHEHNLVVRGICESMEPFGKVAVERMRLLLLPRLAHLTTAIEVELRSAPEFEKIVKALHPTPALGGIPRQAAILWLEQYQRKIDRMRFGAPVGYFRPKVQQGGCFVAIRNAQWNHKGIFIGAGCGVVAESQYEQEWDEVNLKLQATKEMLAL